MLAMAFALGDPAIGAVVLLAHWAGRVVPILAGPVLLEGAWGTTDTLAGIEHLRPMFRASNVLGVGLLALSAMILRAT